MSCASVSTGAQGTEEDLDNVFEVIPWQLWDANYYYYRNYSSIISIRHQTNNFEFYVPLGDISVPGDYYVATFEEHLMVTRIGIVTEISRHLEDAIHLQFSILEGNNPYDINSRRVRIDEYFDMPCPLNKFYEYLRHSRRNERLDTGRYVRQRVRPGYQLELKACTQPSVRYYNTKVFVRVQSASSLGGVNDHTTWTIPPQLQNTKDIVSYDKYKKHMLPFVVHYTLK